MSMIARASSRLITTQVLQLGIQCISLHVRMALICLSNNMAHLDAKGTPMLDERETGCGINEESIQGLHQQIIAVQPEPYCKSNLVETGRQGLGRIHGTLLSLSRHVLFLLTAVCSHFVF